MARGVKTLECMEALRAGHDKMSPKVNFAGDEHDENASSEFGGSSIRERGSGGSPGRPPARPKLGVSKSDGRLPPLPGTPPMSGKDKGKPSLESRHESFNNSFTTVESSKSSESAKSSPGNREGRKVRQVTPQRIKRVASAQLKKELMESFVQITQKKERLGTDSLQSIAQHKSLIAEMRPTRRRIKWNAQITDWERKQSSETRITGLNLTDLQLPGVAPLSRENSLDSSQEFDVAQLPIAAEDNIDSLERNIRRCFKTMKRLSKEIIKDKEVAEQIQTENNEIRKELISMPVPQTQSFRQSQAQISRTVELLNKKIVELHEQTAFLNAQRESIEREAEELLMKAVAPTQTEGSNLGSEDSDIASLDSAALDQCDLDEIGDLASTPARWPRHGHDESVASSDTSRTRRAMTNARMFKRNSATPAAA